jgi:hypothetical protein
MAEIAIKKISEYNKSILHFINIICFFIVGKDYE